MRSRSPLILMEQLLMVLVFALAAAVCLRAFALADRLSRQYTALDQAVIAAESTAEVLKGCRGDYQEAAARLRGVWDGSTLGVQYDENWQRTSGQAAYVVLALPADSGEAGLGIAQVLVYTAEGELLCGLTPVWQEVTE